MANNHNPMPKDSTYIDGMPDKVTKPLIVAVRGQILPTVTGVTERDIERLIMKTAADAYNLGRNHGARDAIARVKDLTRAQRRAILKFVNNEKA